MKKYIIITALLVLSTQAYSARESFQHFSKSLDQRLLMNSSHILKIGDKVRLSKMWLPSSTAEATYNDITNTISLKKENLVKQGRLYRVKSYKEFHVRENYNAFGLKATTIFHELAHGDFDTNIEEDRSNPVNHLINSKIPKWFKSKYPRVNTKIATHEFFGYMAGQVIFVLDDRIQTVLMNHGIHYHSNKCFKKKALEKIAQRLGLDKDLSFKTKESDIDLTNSYIPRDVFVKGEVYDVQTMPKNYQTDLLAYFENQYNIATSYNELIEKLNRSPLYLNKLKTCYSFLNNK